MIPRVPKPTAKLINDAITSHFKSNRSREAALSLRDYLTLNAAAMNGVNAVTLMHRCEKNRLDVFDFISPPELLR